MIQRNVTWNIHGNVGNEIFKWNITNTTTIATYVGKNFWCNIRIRIFQFLIVIQTAVYIAERFVIQWNFSDLKNPRFIIESGFKSRAGYNGARTVYTFLAVWLTILLFLSQKLLLLEATLVGQPSPWWFLLSLCF